MFHLSTEFEITLLSTTLPADCREKMIPCPLPSITLRAITVPWASGNI